VAGGWGLAGGWGGGGGDVWDIYTDKKN
jgi:hypothetical protein